MPPIPHALLERFLSPQRLGGYVRLAGGNHEQAIELYLENLNRCRHFYGRLHWLEIGLRNGINRQLAEKYGENWFDQMSLALEPIERQQIQKAAEMLAKAGKPVSNAHLVGALNFGFWVNLFNNPYENLWRVCLRKAFPGHPGTLQRKELRKKLHPLLRLRNRIAHYEPILNYPLPELECTILDTVRWIEPELTPLP